MQEAPTHQQPAGPTRLLSVGGNDQHSSNQMHLQNQRLTSVPEELRRYMQTRSPVLTIAHPPQLNIQGESSTMQLQDRQFRAENQQSLKRGPPVYEMDGDTRSGKRPAVAQHDGAPPSPSTPSSPTNDAETIYHDDLEELIPFMTAQAYAEFEADFQRRTVNRIEENLRVVQKVHWEKTWEKRREEIDKMFQTFFPELESETGEGSTSKPIPSPINFSGMSPEQQGQTRTFVEQAQLQPPREVDWSPVPLSWPATIVARERARSVDF